MITQLKKNNSIKKFPKPIINQQPKKYTNHFKDPKIFKYNKKYYTIINTQNNDQQNQLLLYNTKNIIN